MSLGRGRPPAAAVGVADNPATLAGAHARGADGFSGMVPGSNPITTDPSAGISDDLGRHLVITEPQHGSDLAPIPGVVDRPLFGGVRTSPAYGTLRDGPGFDGGHVVLRNRRSVTVLHPTEELGPVPSPALPSQRVAPISDPLGRACANAAAIAGGAR